MKNLNDVLRAEGVDGVRARVDAAQPYKPNGKCEPSKLVITRASDIKPEPVEWLWADRFPLGKCTLIAGEGGLGKSLLLARIAATVTRQGEWPCGEGIAPQGSVIILSAEDDAADTIIPRLLAANADCSRVHIISAVRLDDDKGRRGFNLQTDLGEIEKALDKIGDVLLVEIDPITSYLGKVDSHKNAELRSVLEPLGEMAARRRVTVIGSTHLSKSVGGSANSRFLGSVAFVNHTRAAFIVTKDAEDETRRLMVPSKTNLGKALGAIAYRIADTVVGDGVAIWAPYVQWDGLVAISADQAINANQGDKTLTDEAVDLIKAELSDGDKSAAHMRKAGTDAGITPKALRSAREKLGIKPRKDGLQGGWVWSLPKVPSYGN